ncbi:MAG: hypothetical protein HYV26_10335 [Candidatus Hydrogenedentes bacterium]|nr:hypothetical protein [Candidatus Hydrogenedentota bacterium]
MTSKERVRAALGREQADRLPFFMWFHPSTARHLAELLEIPAAHVGEVFGNDVRQAWVNNNHAMEGIVHEYDGEGHLDDWGIGWEKQGAYNQIVHFPLLNANAEEVLRYRFPEDRIEDLLGHMLPVAEHAQDSFLGVDVSPCAFEMYWRLRGMEQAILDLVADEDLAYIMLGRCADFSVMLAEKSLQRFPVDWLWTGDDVAGQQTMIMGPELWRALVKPHLQRVVNIGKRAGLPVAYHCCGALRPIIPDLIDMGIDVLNPVQCSCPGMDPLELKREFGRHLTFMGGVDTQYVLPLGTADEVYRATAGLIEGMTADGGGYILAASHTVPPETPDDNIFAMYEAAGLSQAEIFDRAADLRAEGKILARGL